ncbi:hypothetical protein J3Q64DRAFT_1773160 [Phycomyces blakesleeanus]|uniref:Uncharacterized protein n=2 Tax=Phycomyces blakesleeanus TaxID=4837 RepID=A0A167MRJ4_PHYB8|nr:hypothetical protein PHYBLDRAFT_181313 [Phycomyces blakesleeanus NRRL 1555(-)]OAD73679.1 hypothetical protein PHYBLDRAFT_181313 [Phycomyces blakesleeanus NRRL 1555(-)]|eukprot:XP_018291719.1 hypothetical protein PHYBLDRAFT_181313 [Phycomyces blakesleeanus NRRL 1555(-)]
MEAIDDLANDNIARSLAYTALECRQQHCFANLLPIATKLLRQRIQYLHPTNTNDLKSWSTAVQWQEDSCPEIIETMWDGTGGQSDNDYQDALFQNPVYYKRLDPETMHAMVEFLSRGTKHYVVVLALEDGNEDTSELKYHNTKEFSDEEWKEVVLTWSETAEEAERIFLMMVTQKRTKMTATPESVTSTREAPEDYWGDWSSEENEPSDTKNTKKKVDSECNSDSDDDSEDEFFTRWSKNPGTLTPGIDEGKNLKEPGLGLGGQTSEQEKQEMEEEYDQSYNPLFTVPSMPNLMDAHTNALAELTHILQTSLPSDQSGTTRRNVLQPLTQINPLPKVVSRTQALYNRNQQQQDAWGQTGVPGAYPETPSSGAVETTREEGQSTASALDSTKQEAGRGLLMKSLRALVGAAQLLGYSGTDILSMVKDIVDGK